MNKGGMLFAGVYLLLLVVAVLLAVFSGSVDNSMWVLIPLAATNIPAILLEKTPINGLLLFVLGGMLQWYAVGGVWQLLRSRKREG